jgi:regulator of sirC expression with transglutaminase-like and TPR domain
VNSSVLANPSFEALGRLPDDQLDLALAATLIAQDLRPTVRATDVFRSLASLAARAPRLDGAPPRARARALSEFLFRKEGFGPAPESAGHPAASDIDLVLRNRQGIPITLSLVLIEVARRTGLRLHGIGFPMRFLVGIPGDPDAYIDPWSRGRFLDRTACRGLLAELSGGKLPWREEFLAPATHKQIVQRMLRNLKELYLRRQDVARCLLAAQRLSALAPEDLEEVRDRGVLALHNCEWVRALSDLQRYLAGRPEAEDAPLIRRHARKLRDQILAGTESSLL